MTLEIGNADRPYLLRGIRMHEDPVRGGTVLLVPEKAIPLDQIGMAILSRVDGEATFGEIVNDLATSYDAPTDRIATDVQRFLQQLRERVYLGVKK